ncbi:MAG TPA: hypothetical protein VNG89_13945 [Vicinamibacterales bacterium]|nr:hypothetical protein [Vicinamibacterales bacterium]
MSWAASACSASSSRITSASGATPRIVASSSVTRTAPPPRFVRTPRSREDDEHAAHQPRRHRQEMRPALPVDVLDVDQSQIGFVDQLGRLHAVVRPLAVQAPAGDLPQFVEDERHQRIQSRLVPFPPGLEKNRHLVGRTQNTCILAAFPVVSVSAVPFRL